ncbi:DegV family protein [Caldilinea sp.]|uniref:DegV family protein n=1 Tax=Caldilinea sp. TaxID=2293560 RepID=UPI002B7963F8|nr:DegV family protein [Anaerolineales bacterium]HQY90051.1 DegV family protein [Caldilinea sp.]HRA65263.1 DegV family protein [Caldilinea sp.]
MTPDVMTAANTRIVVDTSSNVPDDLLARYRMLEAPTLVIFGEESYRNKHELSEQDFYVKLAASKVLPTTSQPPPSYFAELYRQAFASGAEHIFVVTVTSKLSGTFRSAQMATQEFGAERFTLWDSNSISIGSGWQAIMAARLLEQGVAREDFLRKMGKLRGEIVGFAALETLKYVARSGRVGNLQAGVGELLQVKPILELWDGAATVIARVRGRKRSLQEVIDCLHNFYGDRPLNIGVIHANAQKDAEALLAQAHTVLTIDEVQFSDIGPAIAALAGPGVVGLAGCPNDLGF